LYVRFNQRYCKFPLTLSLSPVGRGWDESS
jgi:hypothetical protein